MEAQKGKKKEPFKQGIVSLKDSKLLLLMKPNVVLSTHKLLIARHLGNPKLYVQRIIYTSYVS